MLLKIGNRLVNMLSIVKLHYPDDTAKITGAKAWYFFNSFFRVLVQLKMLGIHSFVSSLSLAVPFPFIIFTIKLNIIEIPLYSK